MTCLYPKSLKGNIWPLLRSRGAYWMFCWDCSCAWHQAFNSFTEFCTIRLYPVRHFFYHAAMKNTRFCFRLPLLAAGLLALLSSHTYSGERTDVSPSFAEDLAPDLYRQQHQPAARNFGQCLGDYELRRSAQTSRSRRQMPPAIESFLRPWTV